MSQHPGHPAPGPHGPQFAPPGIQPTAPIPVGWRQDPYGGPPQPVPMPPQQPQQQWVTGPKPYFPPPRMQRPAVIAMAATMTVTASLQWLCALSFAWLVATAGAAGLSTTDIEGGIYHLLRRFHLGLIEGLAIPLYGFPTLAFFLGFVVLAPRPWARMALTLTGVATLAWSAWWLRHDFVWWLPSAAYIGFVCLILWTPGASQWYRQRTA